MQGREAAGRVSVGRSQWAAAGRGARPRLDAHAFAIRARGRLSHLVKRGSGRGAVASAMRAGRGRSASGGATTRPPPAPPAPPSHLPLLHADWRLWWLHPPKCATSFRYTVLDYPWSPMRDTSFPHGTHQVLFPDIAAARNEPKAKLVAFFRQPEERLLSGYFHMNATPPCCTEDWGWNRPTYQRVRRELRMARPFVLGSKWLPGRFHGCMTNMVLARGCMSEHATTSAHARRAIEIVSDFAFVGDVARWNESICLFNAILTGRRFALRHQLAHVRAGGQKSELRTRAAAAAARLATHAHKLPRDTVDGALYAYVRSRLASDLEKHGVRPECCPTYETVQQAANASEICPPPPARAAALHGGAAVGTINGMINGHVGRMLTA